MVVQDLLKHATRNGLIPESNAACSISVRMYDRVLLGIQWFKAGQELYALSQQLTRITNDEQQAAWIGCYTTWCAQYKHMLVEKTVLTNGCIVNTYERLVRACNMLNARLCAGDLFTYLNPEVTK